MMVATQLNYNKLLGELIAIDDQRLASIEVSGLELDSRAIMPGDLFLALPGFAVDGRDYIDKAIAAGAAAVLVEKDDNWLEIIERKGIAIIPLVGLAGQVSDIAGKFYNHPSHSLALIGVTGTNGKTSCTQLMMQLLSCLGKSCGVIGTLGNGVNGKLSESVNTTPDAVVIQRLLAEWRDQQVDVVAMEVSSHGLEQKRVAALQFDLALFTNLSRDHLDYHGSMQAYADSKIRLFKQPGLKQAVINADDVFANDLSEVIAEGVNVLRYSVSGNSVGKTLGNKAAEVWAENIVYHSRGVRADLHTPWGQFSIDSPLLGSFNLSNLLAAISCFGAMGLPVADLVAEVVHLKPIDGRMEQLKVEADVTVVIDYAHTPDALEKALVAMRQHSQGKLWCVFGCGGDRDQGKRPLMGAVVQRHADHVVVTSDNPRFESAADIINQVLGGVDRPTLVEEDRDAAIDFVIANAQPGDSILIAGKGHENYQLVGKQRIPFSDSKQARLALLKRMAGAAL
ncbi:MAG: UDP-N-acetylmuramoyl-L-alanyl-D-glutamate--2,6-diaminopimelate ligase [Spongiibacteraceae bacterium]